MVKTEKTAAENIGTTLGREERNIRNRRRLKQKNFVQRLNEINGLVKIYMVETDTLKWETLDIKDKLTVRIMGHVYMTGHMEFHGTGKRSFYLFSLPGGEMLSFTEAEAETLEILQQKGRIRNGGFALFACIGF